MRLPRRVQTTAPPSPFPAMQEAECVSTLVALRGAYDQAVLLGAPSVLAGVAAAGGGSLATQQGGLRMVAFCSEPISEAWRTNVAHSCGGSGGRHSPGRTDGTPWQPMSTTGVW
jgi:phenylacetate-coenzyme A ligase PaaK-like adenylate-forming protein